MFASSGIEERVMFLRFFVKRKSYVLDKQGVESAKVFRVLPLKLPR